MKITLLIGAIVLFIGFSIYTVNYANRNKHNIKHYDKILGLLIKIIAIIYAMLEIINYIYTEF